MVLSLGDDMTQLSIDSVQSEIGKRIAKKIGIKDTNLHSLLSKAGGKLPRGFKGDLAYLFEAEERTKHPKRRGQVDQRKLETIRKTCLAKIDNMNIERDRSRARSLFLAEFAARMLLFCVALVAALFWLDLI
jgi:hypothetical protein